MDNATKLWPVEQLLHWLYTGEQKYCALPRNTLATLIALLKFANNDTWQCNPSYKTLAKVSLQHRDTVIEKIKLLKASGIIRLVPFDGRPNVYTIYPDRLWISGAFCKIKKKLVGTTDQGSRNRRLGGSELPTLTTALTSSLTNKKQSYQKKPNGFTENYAPAKSAEKVSDLLKNYFEKGKQCQ